MQNRLKTHKIKKGVGFKNSTQLKAAYMSALIAEKKVPAIIGGRGAGKADKAKQVGVGKRGSIIISKELVESLGIGADEKFVVLSLRCQVSVLGMKFFVPKKGRGGGVKLLNGKSPF